MRTPQKSSSPSAGLKFFATNSTWASSCRGCSPSDLAWDHRAQIKRKKEAITSYYAFQDYCAKDKNPECCVRFNVWQTWNVTGQSRRAHWGMTGSVGLTVSMWKMWSWQVWAWRWQRKEAEVWGLVEPWQLQRKVGQFWREGTVCELSVLHPPCSINAGQAPALLISRVGFQVILLFFLDWLTSLRFHQT